MSWNYADGNPLSDKVLHTERLDVHYFEAGSPDGYPVILLHEDLTNARWWAGTQQLLGYRFHSFAPDLRGYGTSLGNALLKPDLQTYSDDLYAFATTLQLPIFFLVGWGLGGVIAMRYMEQHPETLLGVALVNSFLPGEGKNPFEQEKYRHLAHALFASDVVAAGRTIRENFFTNGYFPVGQLSSDTNLAGTGDQSDPQVFDYLLQGSLGQQVNTGDAGNAFYESVKQYNAKPVLAAFPKPLLVIQSLADKLIDHKTYQELVDATNPNDTSHPREQNEIPHVGHCPMVSMAPGFVDDLGGWLSRYSTPNQFVIHPSVLG